ncbi:MAG TPA: hypothetical protein VMK31_00155, partial [Sphingomicrobium sp.]|nr:hypothetical protein [Sphingomicrobium sp.]
MDPLVVVLIALIAAATGVAIGWLVASRRLAVAQQTVESLRLQLTGVTEERDSARTRAEDLGTKVAALTAQQQERDRQFAERMEQLDSKFGQLATSALEKTQTTFLVQAESRLGDALKPVRERLQKYEEQVARVEQDRTEAYGNIKGLVEAMHG